MREGGFPLWRIWSREPCDRSIAIAGLISTLEIWSRDRCQCLSRFRRVNNMAISRRKILILILLRRRFKRKALQTRKKRRFWVRKIYAERCEKGEYHQLVREMKLFDKEYFLQHFRMSPDRFEELLKYVAQKISFLSEESQLVLVKDFV